MESVKDVVTILLLSISSVDSITAFKMVSSPEGKSIVSRNIFFALVTFLAPIVTPENWNVETVAEWLSTNGLSSYCSAFEDNHVSGQVLLTLNKDDLIELGMTRFVWYLLCFVVHLNSIGHRKIFETQIKTLSNDSPINEVS